MNLAEFEASRAAVIGRALIPPGTQGGLYDRVDFAGGVVHRLERMPWWSAIVVRLAIFVVWFAPLLSLRSPRTFGSLEPKAQCACLESLMHSRFYAVRESLKILKLILCFVALGEMRVLEAIGAYDTRPRSPVAGRAS